MEPNYSELMAVAQSPAGRKLLLLLQQTGGESLQQAMEQAARGDFAPAKQQLSSLLDSPEAKKLLQELGGRP